MIRINLASNFSKGQALFSASGEEILFTENEKALEAFKRLVVILLIPGALLAVEMQIKPEKQAKLKAAQAQLDELNIVNGEQGERGKRLQTIQAEIVKYDERWNKLKQIIQSRTLETQIISQIQDIIPERLWLNRISFEDKKLILTGGYLQEADYEEFYKRLIRFEEYFLEAIPNKVNVVWPGNTQVKEFELQIELIQSTYAEGKSTAAKGEH